MLFKTGNWSFSILCMKFQPFYHLLPQSVHTHKSLFGQWIQSESITILLSAQHKIRQVCLLARFSFLIGAAFSTQREKRRAENMHKWATKWKKERRNCQKKWGKFTLINFQFYKVLVNFLSNLKTGIAGWKHFTMCINSFFISIIVIVVVLVVPAWLAIFYEIARACCCGWFNNRIIRNVQKYGNLNSYCEALEWARFLL